MAKLVLSERGAVITQVFVEAEQITIGRERTNHIVVDDAEVSREHAVVVPVGRDHILEDRGSANGTFINGVRADRRILKHGDVVTLGRFNLRYLNARAATVGELDRTMLINGIAKEQAPRGHDPLPESLPAAQSTRPVAYPEARVRIESGPGCGDVVALERVVAIFGAPGRECAVFTRRPHGFFLTAVEGAPPRVNGRDIGREARLLVQGDRIETGDQALRFELTSRPG